MARDAPRSDQKLMHLVYLLPHGDTSRGKVRNDAVFGSISARKIAVKVDFGHCLSLKFSGSCLAASALPP